MNRLTHSLLLFASLIALSGCGEVQNNAATKPKPFTWRITYFDLTDQYQAVAKPTADMVSVIEGRIETVETRLRPLDENGVALPCITYREGQFVQANSTKSFPVHVDAQAELFQFLAAADGQNIRLHLTEPTSDRSIRIGHHNVAAVEVATSVRVSAGKPATDQEM